MTGKELKEWAEQIPDNAEIQQQKDPGYSFMNWVPLDARSLRAHRVYISTPIITEAVIDETKQEEPTL